MQSSRAGCSEDAPRTRSSCASLGAWGPLVGPEGECAAPPGDASARGGRQQPGSATRARHAGHAVLGLYKTSDISEVGSPQLTDATRGSDSRGRSKSYKRKKAREQAAVAESWHTGLQTGGAEDVRRKPKANAAYLFLISHFPYEPPASPRGSYPHTRPDPRCDPHGAWPPGYLAVHGT